ncbi:hypothetical protein [Methylophilus sp. TWE2]|uniref:hypothetical protein n=1 Tax=Methylophilus sp. TWE2 TaxID=1662285 RepID=UPI0006715D60|nr:hypothetical protein [Methylophilus sp. TWE2]AKR42584.1 hypothetical protein ACJ67_03395 [Methylophilus sp. TWE2]
MKNLLAILLFLSSALLIQSNANAAFVGSTSGFGDFLVAAYNQDSNEVDLTATGGKGGVNAYVTVTDYFADAGTISFDWNASLRDGREISFGYLINGVETELGFTDDRNNVPMGSNNVTVAKGDTFGWYFRAIGGDSYMAAKISNISFVASPSAVPENNIAMLMAAGLIGIAALRKKTLI